MSSFNNNDKKAASMISMPFHTFVTSSHLVKAATSPVNRQMSTPPPAFEAEPTERGANKGQPVYRVADRVLGHLYGNMKVSFYQYFREHRIVAIGRKNGFLKEKVFTPEIAYACDVSFDMDGAIAWIRKTGFADVGIGRSEIVPPWEDYPEDQQVARPEPCAEKPKPQAVPTKVEAKAPVLVAQPNPKKSRPFTGKIIEIGETKRPGRDGRPPFTTFLIKLRSESGNLEREFLGEHLGELTEEHSLKKGDLVKLQLLGRERFTVTIDGQDEERTRNTYAIEVIR